MGVDEVTCVCCAADCTVPLPSVDDHVCFVEVSNAVGDVSVKLVGSRLDDVTCGGSPGVDDVTCVCCAADSTVPLPEAVLTIADAASPDPDGTCRV